MFGGTGRPGAYQSIGFGQTADAVYLPGFLTGGLTGDLKLVDAWGIRGAFNHNWDPYWSTSLWGSYASGAVWRQFNRHPLRQGSVLRELQLRQGRVSADYSCNPDFNIAQVGVVTRWTPVKNLTFSAEVGAFFLDQKFTGAAALTRCGSEAGHRLRVQGPEHCFLNVRAQRNF